MRHVYRHSHIFFLCYFWMVASIHLASHPREYSQQRYCFAHVYRTIHIFISSTMFSAQYLDLRMTQIRIRCSGTRKCSQRYQTDHFCEEFFVRHPISENQYVRAEYSLCEHRNFVSEHVTRVPISKRDTKLRYPKAKLT